MQFNVPSPKSDQDCCYIMHEYSLEPLVKLEQNSTSDDHQFVLSRIRKNDKRKRKLRDVETHETQVQSQNKREMPQQVTSFEELIGNYTPMPEVIGVGGSVSYLPTCLTESQPDYSLAYPTNMVSSLAKADYIDDVYKFHGGAADCDALSRDLNNVQAFTKQVLGSYFVYNEERQRHMLNLMRVIIPQQGLNENNIENTQVNVLNFSIDYDLLRHLIDNDDDDPLQSSTT